MVPRGSPLSRRVGQARFERRPTSKTHGRIWWARAAMSRWSHPTVFFQQAANSVRTARRVLAVRQTEGVRNGANLSSCRRLWAAQAAGHSFVDVFRPHRRPGTLLQTFLDRPGVRPLFCRRLWIAQAAGYSFAGCKTLVPLQFRDAAARNTMSYGNCQFSVRFLSRTGPRFG